MCRSPKVLFTSATAHEQFLRGVKDVIETHRVEDAAEMARRGDQDDPRRPVGDPLCRQKTEQFLPDRPFSFGQVVPVVERHGTEAVQAEEPQGPVERLKFVQIDAEQVQGVPEAVLHGPKTRMPNISVKKARSHR